LVLASSRPSTDGGASGAASISAASALGHAGRGRDKGAHGRSSQGNQGEAPRCDPGANSEEGGAPDTSTQIITVLVHGFGKSGDRDFILVRVAELRVHVDGKPTAAQILTEMVDLADPFELFPVGCFLLPERAKQVHVEIDLDPKGSVEGDEIVSQMSVRTPWAFDADAAELARAGEVTVHVDTTRAIAGTADEDVVLFHPSFAARAGREVEGVRTLFVDDDGAQCPAAPFRTIAAALAAVENPGDRIEVCPGRYEESVIVQDSVALHGAGPAAPDRTGDPAAEAVVVSTGPVAFQLGNGHTYVTGFTFVGGPGQTGVETEHQFSAYVVSDNRFVGFDTGIKLVTSGRRPSRLTGNVFQDVRLANIVVRARSPDAVILVGE
jgi:hypothetical protein